MSDHQFIHEHTPRQALSWSLVRFGFQDSWPSVWHYLSDVALHDAHRVSTMLSLELERRRIPVQWSDHSHGVDELFHVAIIEPNGHQFVLPVSAKTMVWARGALRAMMLLPQQTTIDDAIEVLSSAPKCLDMGTVAKDIPPWAVRSGWRIAMTRLVHTCEQDKLVLTTKLNHELRTTLQRYHLNRIGGMSAKEAARLCPPSLARVLEGYELALASCIRKTVRVLQESAKATTQL